jgi:hypothetical protein
MLDLSPILYNGFITAHFRQSKNTLIIIALPQIKGNGLLICEQHNFSIFVDIPSQPDVFLDFKEQMIFRISPSVRGIIFICGIAFR